MHFPRKVPMQLQSCKFEIGFLDHTNQNYFAEFGHHAI